MVEMRPKHVDRASAGEHEVIHFLGGGRPEAVPLKLALLSLLLLLPLALPSAAADTYVCQPAAVETACVYVWTGTYSTTGAQGCVSGYVFVCAGGAHVEYTGYTANIVGAGACVTVPALVCVADTPGQYNYGGRFMVGDELYVYSPAANVVFQGFAGSYNNAPYHVIVFCPSTIATGGTCLVL